VANEQGAGVSDETVAGVKLGGVEGGGREIRGNEGREDGLRIGIWVTGAGRGRRQG
jgi:hypothetical protein